MKGCITTSVVERCKFKISMKLFHTQLFSKHQRTIISSVVRVKQRLSCMAEVRIEKDPPALSLLQHQPAKVNKHIPCNLENLLKKFTPEENHASEYVFNSCTICDGKMLETTVHPSKIGQKN